MRWSRLMELLNANGVRTDTPNLDPVLYVGDSDGELGVFEIDEVEYDPDYHAIVINFGKQVR